MLRRGSSPSQPRSHEVPVCSEVPLATGWNSFGPGHRGTDLWTDPSNCDEYSHVCPVIAECVPRRPCFRWAFCIQQPPSSPTASPNRRGIHLLDAWRCPWNCRVGQSWSPSLESELHGGLSSSTYSEFHCSWSWPNPFLRRLPQQWVGYCFLLFILLLLQSCSPALRLTRRTPGSYPRSCTRFGESWTNKHSHLHSWSPGGIAGAEETMRHWQCSK